MNETANLDRGFACDASDADLKRASRLREATLRRELAFLLQERGAFAPSATPSVTKSSDLRGN